MSAIGGNGMEYDIPLRTDVNLRTTTSQYMCVGMNATTTLNNRFVQMTCDTGTAGSGGTPTNASNYAIGINQSYLTSVGSEVAAIRLFGVSKAVAAVSISAGQYIRAYQGISTTTMKGRVEAIDDRVTASAATMSLTSHTTVLGRALEDASTGTTFSVFLNPQLYDNNLVASTT